MKEVVRSLFSQPNCSGTRFRSFIRIHISEDLTLQLSNHLRTSSRNAAVSANSAHPDLFSVKCLSAAGVDWSVAAARLTFTRFRTDG